MREDVNALYRFLRKYLQFTGVNGLKHVIESFELALRTQH